MIRSFASFSVLSTLLAGCSLSVAPTVRVPESAAARPAPPSKRDARRDSVPVDVAYQVARNDAARSVIVSGESQIDLGRPAFVERHMAKDGSERLRVDADREADGNVLVSVDWQEMSGDGHELKWSPTLSLAPGATGAASLDLGGGDGRRVTVTLKAADKRATKTVAETSKSSGNLASQASGDLASSRAR